MSEEILGVRDKVTPLRLLSLMPSWTDESTFIQIWGPELGEHFWRKFTRERKCNVVNFILELDAKPEAQLWHYLMRMSWQPTPEAVCLSAKEVKADAVEKDIEEKDVVEEKKEFMIFYKRNHAGIVSEFISLPMIAITHEYIGNVVARNPVAALHDMHPDTWDLSHDRRTSEERLPIVSYPEIAAGDIIVQYDADGPMQAWIVVMTDLDELDLDELPYGESPPW